MRLVSFSAPDRQTTAGILIDDDVIIDLSHAACRDACPSLSEMRHPDLATMLSQGLEQWRSRLEKLSAVADARRPVGDCRLHSPIPMPGKVMGAAYNFHDALSERGMKPPAAPVVFFRSGDTVIGPGDDILIPPDVGPVGYEAELAVVIGKPALHVDRSRAMEFVAGYVAHNDVSGSGLIKADEGNFVRGKNLPATAPLGPWMLCRDALPDPYAVRLRLDIDGRILQDGRCSDMVFDIADLIHAITRQVPLYPGDIIATGTPAGTAGSHMPAAWLVPGQKVTVDAGPLGKLPNPVAAGDPFLEH
jgi:2,4-diketo-3-deoxy-L-fuconate hydrolase